ncbi:MAG TPA: hypothetical protein VD994_22100 [Prosthecobacter sp.]|nr:hypothetical protein [Prosthecobacter sp.]
MTRFLFLRRFLLAPLGVVSLVAACPGAVGAAQSAPEASPAMAAAQAFYDGYMKTLTANGDAQAYVLKSKRVSEAFKRAYQTFMQDAGSDPILCAQDYPDAGFTAFRGQVKGDEATVEMKSRDPQFEHRFNVTLKRSGAGEWLIDGTQDLPAKPGK